MKRKNEAGQAVVFVALLIAFGLLGVAGLAVDMGVLRYDKRLQQTAADAAAIAGADELKNGAAGVTSDAQNASASNRFTDGGGGQISSCYDNPNPTPPAQPYVAPVGTVCVQVLNPPQDVTVNGVTFIGGPHHGNSKYVEVLVASVQPTYFMKALGISKETVTARAGDTRVRDT